MTPFAPATILPEEIEITVRAALAEYHRDPAKFRLVWGFPAGCGPDDVRRFIEALAKDGKMWLNDTYQVQVRHFTCEGLHNAEMAHLSIKRIDREVIRDWREMQAIKNELVGPECEGVELFPAESRVVDLANQYHLWVFTDPGVRWPFGYTTGVKSSGTLGKSKQRAFA